MLKNHLKEYRRRACVKQGEAANLLGMSARNYRALEARTPKSVVYFYQLAKRFGVTVDDLLEQDISTIVTPN